ncbi:tRNA synthetases class II (A)-domain-containing protein [Suillus occidentalis]|nr:tRNA synthetases class II (A)-domain-containing protein [Suillus occidentalis]
MSLAFLHSSFLRSRRPSHRIALRLPLRMSSSYDGPWTARKVREEFFSYFRSKNHTFVPSSSTVPYDDPTLLFANAGMNQYKSIFLGTVDPNSERGKLKRAFNSQKCIRAGGKHNDLEDVGKDSYHHTFFEMLGNWSFGDYFKKEAIEFSWDLLTNVYGLPKDRLYVTYYAGDPQNGIPTDEEAKQHWLSQGISPDHVIASKGNFWEMGATGPCGPCSEIHFDRIGGRNAAHLVDGDDPNVLEIWNNVFIQFNRDDDGSLKPLPNKHVDTGMGFERLVSVLQNKLSNYDTDVFSPIFTRIQELTGARPYSGKFGNDDVDGIDTAYRVVADHVRTLSFALSDGGVPNNVGPKKLGAPIGSFFSSLMPVVVETMGDIFPELTKKQDDIKEILDEEEESFSRTLDRGEKLFDQYATAYERSGCQRSLMVQMYGGCMTRTGSPSTSHGSWQRSLSSEFNEKEFEDAQEHSKLASKGSFKKDKADLVKLDVHDLAVLEKNDAIPKTDDSSKFQLGNITATVKGIYYHKAFISSTSNIPADANFGAGGQEYDTGNIAYNGYVLHTGSLKYGQLSVGDEVISSYDELRRWPLRSNHTATHILNFCLREVLGDHIDQRGSLVAPTKLRFDFSHKAQISLPELAKIESMSIDWIKKNVKVYGKDLDLTTAHKISGLRCHPVRVVVLGYDVDEVAKDIDNPKWRSTSVEFCGGTHVAKTGDIKDFLPVTGQEAYEASRVANSLKVRLEQLESAEGKEKDSGLKALSVELGQADISVLLKAELKDRLATLRKALDKQIKEKENAINKAAVNSLVTFFEEKPDSEVYFAILEVDGNAKILQNVVMQGKKLGKTVYVFSVDAEGGKVAHANYVSESARSRGLDARTWASKVSDILGGKAGGKEDGAQGVGVNVAQVEEALKIARETFSSKYN